MSDILKFPIEKISLPNKIKLPGEYQLELAIISLIYQCGSIQTYNILVNELMRLREKLYEKM